MGNWLFLSICSQDTHMQNYVYFIIINNMFVKPTGLTKEQAAYTSACLAIAGGGGGGGNSVTTDTWSQSRPWASSNCSCKNTRSILHHSWHLPNVYKSHSSWVWHGKCGSSRSLLLQWWLLSQLRHRYIFLPSCTKCSSRKLLFSQTRRKSCNLKFRVNWRCHILQQVASVITGRRVYNLEFNNYSAKSVS